MLSNLDSLRQRIELELQMEGEVISAPWYICQMAVHPVAESLREQLAALIDLGHDYYVEESSNLIDADMHHAAMLLITSGLEYIHKLEHHSEVLFEKMCAIENYRILKELPLAEIDNQDVGQKLTDLKRNLIINVTRCIPKLINNDFFRNDDTPDLLGQAVKTLGEEYFKALESGDGELASLIFREYFPGVLAVGRAVAEETVDWQPPQNIRFISEPMFDLLALSGYAYLFGEFRRDLSLWDTCTEVWEQYLGNAEMYKRLAFMVKLVALAKNELMLTVLSFTRESWHKKLQNILRELPLLQLNMDGEPSAFPRFVRSHQSICIRTIAPTEEFSSMHYKPEDIFVDMHLADKLQLDTSRWLGYLNLSKHIEYQRELEARCDFRLEDIEDAANAH